MNHTAQTITYRNTSIGILRSKGASDGRLDKIGENGAMQRPNHGSKPIAARTVNYRWLLALCITTLAACASAPPPSTLPPPVRAALDKAGLGTETLGVVAYPLTGKAAGLAINPHKAQQPGSTMKIVTTLVALDRLGTNARGRTDLLAAAPPQGGIVEGPLYLRGGADTDLDWDSLWGLLRQLREQGVQEIRGGLVVDRQLFNPPRLDVGAAPFDASPEFQYNVIPDALYLNSSLLSYVLRSDDQGVSVRTSPALKNLDLDTSAMLLNDNSCAQWEASWAVPQTSTEGGRMRVRFLGQFPKNCSQTLDLQLLDRQWLTAAVVRQLWEQLGGRISGPDAEGGTPNSAVVLATHMGRPFAEVARGMMKRSDNPLTRLTYLRLGAQSAAPGEPTLAAAARVVNDWLRAKGIPTEGLVMDNGSGLSRSERISAQQMAAVLENAYRSPVAPELLGTMPVAGVDGTLGRRFKDTPVQGRARLKTGTLRNVVALAGYVQDQDNNTWIVVAMLNHDEAPAKGRPVIDSIIQWVAGPH